MSAGGGAGELLDGWGALVPKAVVQSIAKLGALPPAARALLEAGAEVGEPFELDLAIAVAELDEHEALDELDLLLERGLVTPTHVPRRFQFQRPIVQRGVYEGAKLGWRTGAHRRASAALGARGAGSGRAPSPCGVEQAADVGNIEAIGIAEQAGDESAARAPAAAAHWFGVALRLLPPVATGSATRSRCAAGRFEAPNSRRSSATR